MTPSELAKLAEFLGFHYLTPHDGAWHVYVMGRVTQRWSDADLTMALLEKLAEVRPLFAMHACALMQKEASEAGGNKRKPDFLKAVVAAVLKVVK